MATGGGSKEDASPSVEAADSEDGKLMCAICLEKYRRPKLLPCFHTFCQSCLQGVAGSAPSLTCPSCRTFVMLPPGGVRALQTNSFIEEDLSSSTSSPHHWLCDVCTEDKDATHICFQCQQRLCSLCRKCHDGLKVTKGHTVLSLGQEGNEKVRAASLAKEVPKAEMCPKHSDQRVLLHCKQCQVDVCIQCKLTQHEGHPTEDLSDTRAKIKITLEQLLENVTQQRQQIQHLVLALKDMCVQVKSQKQETEESFRGRADTLIQWVRQSLDETVTNLEKSAQDFEKGSQDQVELLEKKDATLQVQQDYVMRILKEGVGADLVPLEAQLSSCRSENAYLKQVEKELSKGLVAFRVELGSPVLRQKQVLEFVGVLKPNQSKQFPLQDFSKTSDAKTDKEEKRTKVFDYSKNSKSSLVAMCPISNSRLWVAYKPAQDASLVLKLLDPDGQVLVTLNNVLNLSGLVNMSDDTVLAWHSKEVIMITPEGKVTMHDLGIDVRCLVSSAGNKLYMADRSTNTLSEVQFSKTNTLTFSETGALHYKIPQTLKAQYVSCRHVSCKGEYIATVDNGVVRVFMTSAPESLGPCAVYTSDLSMQASDVRFCLIDGQEQLLISSQVDEGGRYLACHVYNIHIVDHTDGCRFVDFLNTGRGNNEGKLLATCYLNQKVWVGYRAGKVVMIDL